MMRAGTFLNLILTFVLSFCCPNFQLGVKAVPNEKVHVRRNLQLGIFDPIRTVEVINTETNQKILDLSNGLEIDLSAFGLTSPTQLNFNVVVSTGVQSILFGLNSRSNFQTESTAPYALCGDSNGKFKSCPSFSFGSHNLTVTPFSTSRNIGRALSFQFIVKRSVTPITVPVLPPVQVPTPPAPIKPTPAVPTKVPTLVPRSPTQAVPTKVPTSAPIPAVPTNVLVQPAIAPASNTSCTVPKFVGKWENYKAIPVPVGESHGAVFGNDFAIFSGFSTSYQITTRRAFALDLRNPINGNWRELDPVPLELSPGFSHSALVRVGNVAYFCGGYIGGTPGPSTKLCFKYDHSVAPNTTGQWSPMPSLPGTRAGAAMFYDKATHSLTFATGADRSNPKRPSFTVDHNETYALNLSNVDAGWVYKGATPFRSNHIGKVTVEYNGAERHYMLGGQIEEDEGDGNVDDVFELHAATHQWTRRRSMIFPRGHFSESSIPWGNCGFMIAGGSINNGPNVNGFTRTSDISYYDIGSDSWSYVGNLTRTMPTAVCVLHGGYIYCQSGPVSGTFSSRRRIV
jgi:hypothetical protein